MNCAENSSAGELGGQLILAKQLPLGDATPEDGVDVFLRGLRDLRCLSGKDNARTLRLAEQKIQKKNATITAMKKEVDNLSAILKNSKASYLCELIAAERKIKGLEQRLIENEKFLNKILVANESLSKMIRSQCGNDNAKLADSSFEPMANENISELSANIAAAPVVPVATTAAIATDELNKPKSTEEMENPTAEVEKPIPDTELSDEPIVAGIDAIEPQAEHMETEESVVQPRFSCDECNKTFRKMAKLYRHQVKSHGNVHNSEQVEVKKKQHTKRALSEEDIFEFMAQNYADSTPMDRALLLKQLHRLRYPRAKKIARKNKM